MGYHKQACARKRGLATDLQRIIQRLNFVTSILVVLARIEARIEIPSIVECGECSKAFSFDLTVIQCLLSQH